jgi:hypothetical protein
MSSSSSTPNTTKQRKHFKDQNKNSGVRVWVFLFIYVSLYILDADLYVKENKSWCHLQQRNTFLHTRSYGKSNNPRARERESIYIRGRTIRETCLIVTRSTTSSECVLHESYGYTVNSLLNHIPINP